MATTAFEDLSATPETETHDIIVAQADASSEVAGDATAVTPTGPAAATTTIEVADDLTLTLPADASIELPRVNGTDLEFVQPDGSVIVVPNGALIGLTIVIGDTTIPAEAVAALFSANNIETAAGPEASALPSSGGNFATPVPGIGDDLPLIDLLGYDDYDLGTPELEEIVDGFGFRRTAAKNRPTIDIDPREDDSGNGNAGPGSALVNEAGLSIGSDDTANSESATGSFTLGDPDGLATLVSLTIGGDTVAMSGVVGSTFSGLYGTLTITAYNAATGVVDYRYELTGPYTTNPAAANGPNIELGRDVFVVTVSDGLTDSLPAAITIDIVDDVPSVSGFAPDGKLPVILDDDDVADYAAGNPGGDGDDGAGTTTTGSMQFSAGADGLKSIVISPIIGLTAIHVDSVTGIGTPYLVDQVWVARSSVSCNCQAGCSEADASNSKRSISSPTRRPRTSAILRSSDRPRDRRRLCYILSAAQQIRGSCSPTSISTMRLPPNRVRMVTMPTLVETARPMIAASMPAGTERIAASAASA